MATIWFDDKDVQENDHIALRLLILAAFVIALAAITWSIGHLLLR
jgi:hypothetical protein